MRDYYKRLVNFIAIMIAVAFEALSYGYLWYTHYSVLIDHHIGKHFYRRGNWAMIGLYILVMVLLTNAFDGYKITYMRLRDIILSHVPSIIIANVIGYIEICLTGGIYFSASPLVLLCAVQIVFIILWAYLTRRIYVILYPPRELLLIYGKYPYEHICDKLNERKDRYNISGKISIDEDMSEIESLLLKYRAAILADLPDERRNSIIKFCSANSIRVYVTPKISDIMFRGADDIHLFDTPLFLIRNNGIPVDKLIVKRAMDIVSSLLGIIILSPMMLIIALAIKLYDGGPVFYTQDRLTKDGREFKIYKFRSMRVNAEKEGARLAAKGDARITPVGAVIRQLHVDELPQLFNILKGDMALVGPRPERRQIADEYADSMPEFDLRLKVKAGLTGYAQVYGQYNTTPYDKLKLDLIYIANYSILMDIKIILLTVKILFVRENTEGVDADQKTALKKEK